MLRGALNDADTLHAVADALPAASSYAGDPQAGEVVISYLQRLLAERPRVSFEPRTQTRSGDCSRPPRLLATRGLWRSPTPSPTFSRWADPSGTKSSLGPAKTARQRGSA